MSYISGCKCGDTMFFFPAAFTANLFSLDGEGQACGCVAGFREGSHSGTIHTFAVFLVN